MALKCVFPQKGKKKGFGKLHLKVKPRGENLKQIWTISKNP